MLSGIHGGEGSFPLLPKQEVLHNRQVLDALEQLLLSPAGRKTTGCSVQAEWSLPRLLHRTATTLQLCPFSASRCKQGQHLLASWLRPL